MNRGATSPRKTREAGEAIAEKGPRTRVQLCILLGASLVLLVLGWRLFWFLTDDAYISFRYASNHILGYGYVWNFPPFRPVEGYTNFLWVLLVEGVWRLFHVPPPVSANYLALVFSYLTLIVLAVMTLRIDWRPELHPHRIAFIGLALLYLLVNRTFLAWTSSGLETAMFTFIVIAWVYCSLSPQKPLGWPVFFTSLAAALMELTRPDGMLYAAGTVIIVMYLSIKKRPAPKILQYLAVTPLLAIPLHFAWRFKTYGEWLPNSYYAKQGPWWPEAGLRYALSFCLEYALWTWIALCAFVALRKGGRAAIKKEFSFPQAVVFATLLCHFLYYTIVTGGDHFEYRVYNHFLVLIPFSFLWLLNRTTMRTAGAVAAMLLFIALSLPVPWTHWHYSHNLNTRKETYKLKVPVAPHWPKPVRWYAAMFDRAQFYLIEHLVCMRHQEHKICHEYLLGLYPSREEGLRLPPEGYPVFAELSVGIASWTLPRVNIIDLFGINDYAVARMPVPPDRPRLMAHDHLGTKEYAFCFDPDVYVKDRKPIIIKREVPLTAEKIIQCEREWRDKVKQGVARRAP